MLKEIPGQSDRVTNSDQQQLIGMGRIRTMVSSHGNLRMYREASLRNSGFEVRVVAGSEEDMFTQGRSFLVRESGGKNKIPVLITRVEVLTVHVPDGKLGMSIQRPRDKSFEDLERTLEAVRREVVVKNFRG